MKRLVCIATVLAAAVVGPAGAEYEPNWQSIDSRPIPAWFDEAKFGIFIHWGVYSVPAWAPKGKYAEWYWHSMQNKNGPTWQFHARTYGEDFQYQDFAPMFKAEMFDPDAWAELFVRSGARYVVLTSKHHDGYCLWPSTRSWDWNSVYVGPHRDLVGDLTKSVRAKGLKMGLYYSLYEWYNPLYRSDPERYVAEHMLPQLKDLIRRYQPSVIFSDGEWDHPSELWRSTEFLAWLYNDAPNKDEVVVDDRWGKDARRKHGGYYTTEYGAIEGKDNPFAGHKWEECRGMGASFGYNRNEDAWDYKSSTELIAFLVEVVSRGGNLLLDIGPTADGRIPVEMQERLLDIGRWLETNGEAIYGTRPWRVSSEGDVRYTRKGDTVYAICLKWPGTELVLTEPKPSKDAQVTLLGCERPLKWRESGGKMAIEMGGLPVGGIACAGPWTFKIEPAR